MVTLLSSKNLKLIPLSAYKIRNQIISCKKTSSNEFIDHVDDNDYLDDDDDLETTSAYYDIKIRNEINQNLEYKLIKSFPRSKSFMSFDVQKTKSNSSIFSSSLFSTSSASNKSMESIKSSNLDHIQSKSMLSMSSQSSILSNCKQESYSTPLKVEYVPKGKIVTVNVSIMW